MSPEIAVLDSRSGNYRSVTNAFEKVGASTILSADPDQILEADGLVIPGVGAFPAAMEDLEKRDLIATLNKFKELGRPVLGICLGMQLMFESSWEQHESGTGPTEGLGWVEGTVRQLATNGRTNIGWANVSWLDEAKLGKGVNGQPFYHLHSYACEPSSLDAVAAYSDYPSNENQDSVFVSAVQQENLYGVQFHPEKSGRGAGLAIIKNFCELAA